MSNPDADSRAGAPPRVLVVGHLTEDRTREGPPARRRGRLRRLLAHRFGAPTTILTAADAAFPFLDALAGIRILRLPSDARTRFDNHYRKDGARRQRILDRAAEIPEPALRRTVAALPPGSAVLYAPVARELGGSGTLPRPSGEGSFAAAAPQGLLRRWDAEGRVAVSRPDGLADRLAALDLVSLAEAELPEATPAAGPPAGDHARTAGSAAAPPGLPDEEVPPAPAAETDPTGAGDVFAAALFVSLWRGLPLGRAAGLAAAAAAISVESPGTAGVPTLEQAAAPRQRPSREIASGLTRAPGDPPGPDAAALEEDVRPERLRFRRLPLHPQTDRKIAPSLVAGADRHPVRPLRTGVVAPAEIEERRPAGGLHLPVAERPVHPFGRGEAVNHRLPDRDRELAAEIGDRVGGLRPGVVAPCVVTPGVVAPRRACRSRALRLAPTARRSSPLRFSRTASKSTNSWRASHPRRRPPSVSARRRNRDPDRRYRRGSAGPPRRRAALRRGRLTSTILTGRR